MPGAEPSFYEGGPVGVLVLHGFTGNPGSMRGLAEAPGRRRASRSTSPCCPGHGTVVEDMIDTGWPTGRPTPRPATRPWPTAASRWWWSGLSMGGALDGLAGLRAPGDRRAGLHQRRGLGASEACARPSPEVLATGADRFAGIGSDIAEPGGGGERPTPRRPLAPLLTLFDAADDVRRTGWATSPRRC